MSVGIDGVLDPDQRVENHRPAVVAVDVIRVDAGVGAVVRIPAIDAEFGLVRRLGRVRPGLPLRDLGVFRQREFDHGVVLRVSRRALLVRYRRCRWSACRCAPAGSRSSLSFFVHPGQRVLHPVLCRRASDNPRAHAPPRLSVRLRAESIVTTACAIRLSSSSVSIRSEFQISDRSLTLHVGHAGIDIVDQLVTFIEHLAGAEHGAIGLHHPLHVQPQLGGRRAALGVAELVEPRQRQLGGILRQIRDACRRVSATSAQRCAAARPNTTRSISEFEPSRLAPCTETQAASPSAIRPGIDAVGHRRFS